MKNIIAFSGSNSPTSINNQLLKAVSKLISNVQIHIVDLARFDIPIYNPKIESEGLPLAVKELYEEFVSADGFVIASPEHNGLPSALLKNTFDWLSRIDQEFLGAKPVLLMGTSPGGNGGASHLDILLGLLPRWGGVANGYFALSSFYENFDSQTRTITSHKEQERLIELVMQFQAQLHDEKIKV